MHAIGGKKPGQYRSGMRFDIDWKGHRLGLMLLGWMCLASLAKGGPPDSPLVSSFEPVVPLTEGWENPPRESRVCCWWWWLNGNVDQAAITADLEQMKAQGFGGANIIDAGGAEQRGHQQVPHGPDFASPEWTKLFVHAVAEADRLGLELGLNIQSGWNLGGPTVKPTEAAKKLTFSEFDLTGPTRGPISLPTPPTVAGFYQELAVLALPSDSRRRIPAVQIHAGTAQPDHPAELMSDGDEATFWVSATDTAGTGPSKSNPHLVRLEFSERAFVDTILFTPRPGYGPQRGWVQTQDHPNAWRVVRKWEAPATGPVTIRFPRQHTQRLRLVIVNSHDPLKPDAPRNLQIAELQARDGETIYPPEPFGPRKVLNFRQKAYYDYPGGFTATRADHLLAPYPASRPGLPLEKVLDLTKRVTKAGQLEWTPPSGPWRIVRLGYTLSNSRVSTSSENWEGWAIDYLDPRCFQTYWTEVVKPLLAAAKPYVGKSLKYLHTDSWELGPVNWTPRMLVEFKQRRGYSLEPYLPVLAGYVIINDETSNRVLADFRRTLADLIAEGKYRTFADLSHAEGLGVHPESGGPHAAPVDALLCLGLNDIPMGEFWARSPTHRVTDPARFFTKQPASAAHIYGKRIVMAEAFTTIGPQWEEDPRSLKPVFDQAACEGLNLVMFHTFTCSPKSAGLPGQEYFAGSHISPRITWWPRIGGFVNYLNRSQFLLQQGLPVSDVLYFYGENVPSFVRLQADDPASVQPDYDYDVINAEALLANTSVKNGKVVLPNGTSYAVLALPETNSYSLRVLEHVGKLAQQGATVVGRPPQHPLGLEATPAARQRFSQLVAELWSPQKTTAPRIRSESARQALERLSLGPDFTAQSITRLRSIHRSCQGAEIYFVSNPTDRTLFSECSFRITGRQPEVWDPVTGERVTTPPFHQANGRTIVPLDLAPNGATFVVFTNPIEASASLPPNEIHAPQRQPLTAPWEVEFRPELGGPAKSVKFSELTDWAQHSDQRVHYYSGPAVYRTQFDAPPGWPPEGELVLDLGEVLNIAEVRLNGHSVGIAWTPPFRVKLPGNLRPQGNELEVEVTNLWPNRLIGDSRLPKAKRLTRTNITKYQPDSPLLPSGLLGPVELLLFAPNP